jgi:hypothetical protein
LVAAAKVAQAVNENSVKSKSIISEIKSEIMSIGKPAGEMSAKDTAQVLPPDASQRAIELRTAGLTHLQKQSNCILVPADDSLPLLQPYNANTNTNENVSIPRMLFLDRLEYWLPHKEFLLPEDVAAVESKITTFDIPRPVKIQIQAGWVPVALRIWMEKNLGMCPNCK